MDSDFPTSIGRLGVTAFDCPDALALADFYNSIIGAEKATTQPTPDQFRVTIDPAGHPFCLVLAPTV